MAMFDSPHIQIGSRAIGGGAPCYIVAEVSANHGQNFDQAAGIIRAAHEAGADAIKVQTYTPDTLTIDCDNECFRIGKGTAWEGRSLYDLYREAFMPWDWQPRLKEIAEGLEMDFFSTPFDATAVDFLEGMGVPAHKIASFELVDVPFLKKVASTGKPVILSTGMATLAEIDEAVSVLRDGGAPQVALLKCTSAYPATASEMNLRTIPHLAEAFGVPVGLSDHTLGAAVPVAAVAMGACMIEKHFTLSRDLKGPDASFSAEPAEFRAMVEMVRDAERAMGCVSYRVTEHEGACRMFRRSIFVVRDMKAGEVFNAENARSIRPGNGLHPRFLSAVLGRRAARDIARGSPLSWDMVK
jgi:pseudaminic acid synthase